MTDAEGWTRITAWLAFAAWFISLMSLRPPAAGLWLLGSLVMVTHTAVAFHAYHGWSHAAAVADTARQTREITGLDWGGGVWLNYLFTMVWLGDACWRVAMPRAYTLRPGWLARLTHGFLAFIWFNATVVFGSWPVRVAGLLAFAMLGFKWRGRTRADRHVGARPT